MKIVLSIHTNGVGWQIADMPNRRGNGIFFAQDFFQSPGFGGGLYNDQWVLRFSHGFFRRTNSGRQKEEASGKLRWGQNVWWAGSLIELGWANRQEVGFGW